VAGPGGAVQVRSISLPDTGVATTFVGIPGVCADVELANITQKKEKTIIRALVRLNAIRPECNNGYVLK